MLGRTIFTGKRLLAAEIPAIMNNEMFVGVAKKSNEKFLWLGQPSSHDSKENDPQTGERLAVYDWVLRTPETEKQFLEIGLIEINPLTEERFLFFGLSIPGFIEAMETAAKKTGLRL